MRLATSGTDGAVYVYLEDVDPGGDVAYLTEGCLRFLHLRTTGPAEPTRLGVPRTFPDQTPFAWYPGVLWPWPCHCCPSPPSSRPGTGSGSLLPGRDASCFTSYGPAEETFTLEHVASSPVGVRASG